MKSFKILGYALAISTMLSCSDDENGITEKTILEEENTALLISDVNSTKLNLLKPFDKTVQSFEASYSGGSVYVTESGSYGVITHRDHNFTETFSLGGEIPHGDHSHNLGEVGMGAISFESEKPTHFKSEQGFVLVYNDGDATLNLFNENSIHNNASPVRSIGTGSVAHHGAMVVFNNGTIAVTALGNGVGLPEKVQIINQSGEVVYGGESSVVTSGIHGSAGNGTVAVFGSNTGVLVVKSTGEQSLIDYPNDFEEDVWFGSLLSTNVANVFVGYTASKGVYFINIDSKKITPVFENTNLFKCMMSKEGDLVAGLSKEGNFSVTDVVSGVVQYQGKLNITMDTESTDHGSVISNMAITDSFLYISIPSNKKIVQIDLADLTIQNEFNLEITPYQFQVLKHDLDH